MKSFQKVLSSVAAAAALVVAVPAQASTVAIADLNIFLLGLVNATTLAPFAPADGSLSILNESRTGNATSSFNNVTGTGAGSSNLASNIVGDDVDVKYRCAGDCGPGTLGLYSGGNPENDTTTHLTTPGTRNFAIGDMYISGTTLGGGITGLTRANAVTAGSTNKGNANATIQNSATIQGQFQVGNTFNGRIAVGANAWVQAFVDSMLPVKGSATASYGWNLSITSFDDTSFSELFFRPQDLNKGFFSTSMAQNNMFNNGNTNTPGASNTYFSDARTFNSGSTYNFTINQSSNANVSEIPEPMSLALVGLGLLAAGVVRRAKSTKSAN